MLLVLDNDRGAVTAEFMLLLPALIMLFTFVLGSVTFAAERIAIESKVFEATRAISLGQDPSIDPKYLLTQSIQGRKICVTLSRQMLLPIKSTLCMLPVGK
ncbi:MAG: hypothetical protein P8M68_04630 [Aquiluna sp.]|nr:hypothetical protein [Aquiluna sp.]